MSFVLLCDLPGAEDDTKLGSLIFEADRDIYRFNFLASEKSGSYGYELWVN